MNRQQLLTAAKEKYKQGTKTTKGKVIGEIRWNKDLSKIVSDTVNIYDFKSGTWVEIF